MDWKIYEESDELKPCPFCGGNAMLIDDFYTYVECEDCSSKTKERFRSTYKAAIESWNKRV